MQKKRSKQRAECLQTQDVTKARRTKAKARAVYKANPEKKKASVRDSCKADPEKMKASVRDSYKADPEKKKAYVYVTATRPILILSVLLKGGDMKNLEVLLKGGDVKRTSRRTVLLKSGDMKRTSRKTALLKVRNTRAIQLPLKHLKGVGIGMTPLSDWLNMLPRGRGTAGITELPLPPKDINIIKKQCMQPVLPRLTDWRKSRTAS